jgi:serine protease
MKFQKRHVKATFGIFALSLMATSIAQATGVTGFGDLKKSVAEGEALVKGPADNVSETLIVGDEAKEEALRYIVTFKQPKSKLANSFGSVDSTSKLSKKTKGVADVAMVKNGEVDKDAATKMLKKIGVAPQKFIRGKRSAAVKMKRAALKMLLENNQVESIEPDPVRSLLAESTPYGITMVQANQLAQSDPGIKTVCIIDTGYNLNHPDLPDLNDGVSGIANNSAVGNWYNDGNGHGTHVAGTIAALSNNEGVVGVYPGVDLHIVKIFDDSGSWTFASDLIDAISQCQDAGADVVNMSLGGGAASTTELNAMQTFDNQGMLLVAAAGNSGNTTLSYPASYDAVMSVAAVDSSENRASYSQYNSEVEIAGPGSSVSSTWPVDSYNTISGTSMATPHVVGAAALVWSFFPECSNAEIRTTLNDTAKDKGSAGRDNLYGNGIVQSKDAYDYLNIYGCAGDTGGGNGGGTVDPVNETVSNLSDNSGWLRGTREIPEGVTSVTFAISGGSGDADLYIRYGSSPSTTAFDCRPYEAGNTETCTFSNPAAGTWHIGLNAYSAYSGVTFSFSYQ